MSTRSAMAVVEILKKNSLSCVHASRHIPIDLENSPAGSSPPRSRSWAPCTRQTAKPPAARAQASASAFAGKPVASRKMCRRVASHIRAECARRKMTKRTWNVAFTLPARFMAHPAKNGQGFSFRSQSLAVAGALHRRGNCCRGRNLLSIRWVLAFPTRRIPEFRTAESPESTGSQLQIGGGGGVGIDCYARGLPGRKLSLWPLFFAPNSAIKMTNRQAHFSFVFELV